MERSTKYEAIVKNNNQLCFISSDETHVFYMRGWKEIREDQEGEKYIVWGSTHLYIDIVPIEDNYIRIGDKMKFNEESDVVTCIDCNEKQVKSRGGWYDREGTIKVKDLKEDTELNVTPGEWYLERKSAGVAIYSPVAPSSRHSRQIVASIYGSDQQKDNAALLLQAKNMYAVLKEVVKMDGSLFYPGLHERIETILSNCKPKP